MKAKHLLSTAIAVCMLMGNLPQPAFADSKDFGGRAQMSWEDCSGGWGTVTLEKGKILKAGEGSKLENIGSGQSVFKQFNYNRGQNFYTGFSKNATFAYDTEQSDYGARLASGKYFYAVYDNANDKNNYKVDFAARFSSDLQQLIKKGDIEAAIVAETDNYKGTTNKQRGVANLRFYSYKSAIQQEITTQENWHDGTRTVYADWIKLNSDITRMMLNLRSSRKGLKKFNKSSVQKVRVFLRDSVGPAVKGSGIDGGDFSTRKNVNGETVNTLKIGQTVRYYVQFDEKVDITDTSKLKLRLTADPQKNTDKTCFDAAFKEVKGDKAIFEYTVPDNTNNKNGELTVFLTPSKLICGKECITDIAGNKLSDDSVSGYFSNNTYTVDDTYTGINKRAFEENSKKFYPPVSQMSDTSCNLYGSIPREIIGKNAAQPIVFAKSSTTGPVFRIVLNEEIQKAQLTGATKLKLQVYDADKRKVDGKYVYASLVGARVIGVNGNVQAKGIKSDAHTELYFRYLPEEVSGYPIYRLDFAGSYGSGGEFTFEEDAITCGGSKLRNISDLEVDGRNLKVPGSYRDLLPLAIGVRVDTEAPKLAEKNISQKWAAKPDSDASLVFEDDGGLDFTKGAKLSVVYYDEKGSKHSLKTKLEGASSIQDTLMLPLNRSGGSKNKAAVDVSGVRLLKEYPADYDLYLEYAVYDEAGNEAGNANQKNIRLYLDNTAPVVKSVEEIRSNKDLTVKYHVTDTGIGAIDPYIEYILKNYEKDTSENLNTQDNRQEININALEDSYDRWQVLAKFRDMVGNVSDWNPSGIYATASRNLRYELSDTADSVVSDRHAITVDLQKPTDTSHASFEVQYGWKRGARAVLADAKSTRTFTDAAAFTSFDFASEEIQKQYNNGDLFDGEFTLVLNVVLKPDNVSQRHSQSYYFDTKAPQGVITIEKGREGVNSSYDIIYSLSDNAGEYNGGSYVKEKNIDFSEGNAPKMTLFIGENAVETYPITTFVSMQSINFYEKFAENETYRDETTAHVEISLRDKFGHEITLKSENMSIDLKKPEISEISVQASGLVKRGEDTYIINSFNDISSITLVAEDAAGDKLDVSCIRDGYYTTSRIGKEDGESAYRYVVSKPMQNDFVTTYEDGALQYVYTFYVTDMGGNSTLKSVSFIVDHTEPSIYFVNTENIDNMTNAAGETVELRYRYDSYETPEDINVAISGAELAEHSEIGVIRLNVSKNGIVSVTTTDKTGKRDEKSFEVSCFDRENPTITLDSLMQTPTDGAAKYGEITLSVRDNDSLTALGIAITKGEPADGDFFEDTAASRIIGDEETDNPVYAKDGYFGDSTGAAFANIIPIHTVGSRGAQAGYQLVYGAIPDGTYGVYARVSDSAGNVTTEKLTEIRTSGALADAETVYTPGSDTPTGGAVTAKVTTDIPVQLLGGQNADDNIEAMREHAQKSREKGYTYSYNGTTITLSYEDAIAKCQEIVRKFSTDEGPSEEERYLVRYDPNDYENSGRYTGYLTEAKYTEPVGDMYDWLRNECLTVESYNYETGEYAFDPEGDFYVYIYDEAYSNEVHGFLVDFMEGEPDDGEGSVAPTPVIQIPGFPRGGVVNLSTCGEEEFDKWQVPSVVDTALLTPVGEERTNDEYNILNPFYGKKSVSADELRTVFDSDLDLSLLSYSASTGLYENPFGENDMLYIAEIQPELRSHMEAFLANYKQAYKNPFITHEYSRYPELAYGDIMTILRALGRYQAFRDQTAEAVADKYARGYLSINGNTFSQEHTLTFHNNINANYSLMDVLGRRKSLSLLIDWIDNSKPHVPQSDISFTVGGNPLAAKYTNAESGMVEVLLPDEGVYNEYRIVNIPEGAVGIGESAGEDGRMLYRGFTLNVSENGNVGFDVLNPVGTDKDAYHQIYVVDQFDRSGPTCELIYSPKKPGDGASVNTDVTVSLSSVKDNLTAPDQISVNATSYTFNQNGSFEFRLADEAGNETVIPVEIDYIDKNPTMLDIEFTSGGQVLDKTAYFTEVCDDSDYKNVTYTYEYKGGYLKNDVEAMIRYNGSKVQLINISDDSEYTYEYIAKSGSRAHVSIKGVKLDQEPPEASVTYTPVAATAGKKDSVVASIVLSDNISAATSISLVSVTGRDNGGTAYGAGDVVMEADGSRTLTFHNNGFVNLVFKDEAGNTTEVQLNVSNLDRTAPRAFISYSTVEPTNGDVVANISLNKLADYRIYGAGNTILKDYSGTYTSYVTYTFEENGSRLFQFRDISGNETASLLASVDNIDKEKPELRANVLPNTMLTDDGQLQTFMGAATIELTAVSAGDTLAGDESDTILIQNASQSRYHSVMSNGRYPFRYMDRAGNFDTLYVDVDCIDTTLPTASDSGNPTEWTNVAPKITITPNTKSSGVKTYIVQNGVKNNRIEFTPTKNGTYSFMVTDEIGNSAAHKVEVRFVDLDAPILDYTNSYNGNRNIFINAGEFDKASFENVIAYDEESGLASTAVDYPENFDSSVPGKYDVKFTAVDKAGNASVLTRRIQVISPDDVFAAIDGTILIPNEQATFMLGEKLELSFMNADKVGDKVSYAFVKGFYNGAQMKGKSFKTLTSADAKIQLTPEEAGMYTLFVQTENRSMMVMYVFIAG